MELIYDRDCPNVSEAREQLRRTFTTLGLVPSWKEWDRNSDTSPSYAKAYGSPTILVDGKDCAGVEPSSANCCRIYESSSGSKQEVPPLDVLIAALKENNSAHTGKSGSKVGWLPGAAMLSGIGVALLPNLGCPACWPAYAGLLSAAGLGFLVNAKYLFALTVVLLVIGVGVLAFRARSRRGYLPVLLGALGALAVIIGKFAMGSNAVTYGGVSLLLMASVWNSWPRRVVEGGSCPSCAQTQPLPK